MLIAVSPSASQDWKVAPTWLHRYAPEVADQAVDLSAGACHYKPIFGEGDAEARSLQTVLRFGELAVGAHGACTDVEYPRQEEIYFVLEGSGTLHYAEQTRDIRQNDFTYLPPAVRHGLSNSASQPLRVALITLRIPDDISLFAPPAAPAVANLDELKEQTVEGHPASVLYKVLIGPRTGTRDRINAAYILTDFFLMDFAPGGTNFPHHHEAAEEIYLVLDGEGQMVAGGGIDGIEGRHPAKAGDAYYFRPNCTVGFYNRSAPGAKAHILAVRARVPLPRNPD